MAGARRSASAAINIEILVINGTWQEFHIKKEDNR